MSKYLKDQRGVAPFLIMLAILGFLVFIAIATFGSSKNKLFSSLFPKPKSNAQVAGIVDLSLMPSQLNVAPGGSFDLNVSMDAKTASVSAATIVLKWDPTILQATKWTQGSLLKGLFPSSPNPYIDNTTGGAIIALNVGVVCTNPLDQSTCTPNPPALGQGILATLSFQAVKATASGSPVVVSFDPTNTLVAAIGYSGNVVGLMNPSSITVGNATPVPTPTLTPIPTPTPTLIPTPTPTPVSLPTPTPTPVPTPTPTLAPTATIVEAESMSLIANSGAIQVFSDPLASSQAGLIFYSNATSSKSFTTSVNSSQVVIRAKGDQCKGAPRMAVSIDNVKLFNKDAAISATSWTDYIYTKALSAGAHTLSVSFTNDYSTTRSGGCDRNLRLDKITFK